MLDPNQINEFRNSGVLLLKGHFLEWIEGLRRGVEFNLKHPGEFSRIYTGKDESGFFFGDYCNWNRIPEYRHFLYASPCAELAAELAQRKSESSMNMFW